MPTREDLLIGFNRFTDEQLEKLSVIGDSILSPLDTELTSVDFASMMEQVLKSNGLADRYFPEWTDRAKSDFGRFLVELFAVFSDKDMTYINHFSNEGFVGRAELYRSLFHKAVNQGFNPPSNISSSGKVEIVFSSGALEFVPRGAIALAISDIPNTTYLNEEFYIKPSSIDEPQVIVFRHGELKKETGFFDGYSIRGANSNVSNDTVRLFINGEEWHEVKNFLKSSNSSKHYVVVFDELGRPEILFGKEGFGATPDEGVLYEIEEIIGGGYGGDIGDNLLNKVIYSETNRNLLSFKQYAMTGGNSQMSMEVLRQVITGKARHQNRVVTPQDAMAFCLELSFVKKVFAEAFQNYCYIYVLPTSGGALTHSQINLVKKKINPDDALLMGYNLTVSSPIFVPIKMDITIPLHRDTLRSGAMVVATQTAREYLDANLTGTFGKGVNRSQLTALILGRLTGSENVLFTTLHRLGVPQPVADISANSQEVIDYVNSVITITLEGGK